MNWRWWFRIGINPPPLADLDYLRAKALNDIVRVFIDSWKRQTVAFFETYRAAMLPVVEQMTQIVNAVGEAFRAAFAEVDRDAALRAESDPGPWLRGDQ